MSKLAHEGNYQLALVRVMNVNGKNKKSIYSFNPQKSQTFSLYKNSNLKYLSKNDLELEDVQGTYYTNATKQDLTKLENALTNLGLNFATQKVSLSSAIKGNLIFNSYLPILISIFSILLVIMLIEKISYFKKYAILQLNGLTKKQILFRDVRQNYPLFLGSVLGIWLIYLIYSLIVLNKAGFLLAAPASGIIVLLILVIFAIIDLFSYLALLMIDLYPAFKANLILNSLWVQDIS